MHVRYLYFETRAVDAHARVSTKTRGSAERARGSLLGGAGVLRDEGRFRVLLRLGGLVEALVDLEFVSAPRSSSRALSRCKTSSAPNRQRASNTWARRRRTPGPAEPSSPSVRDVRARARARRRRETHPRDTERRRRGPPWTTGAIPRARAWTRSSPSSGRGGDAVPGPDLLGQHGVGGGRGRRVDWHRADRGALQEERRRDTVGEEPTLGPHHVDAVRPIRVTVPAPAKVPTTAPGKIGPRPQAWFLAGRDLRESACLRTHRIQDPLIGRPAGEQSRDSPRVHLSLREARTRA